MKKPRRSLTNIVSVLTAARALIVKGWTQHAFSIYDTKTKTHEFCSLGAIRTVSRNRVVSDAAAIALRSASRIDSVIDWNDRPRTTKAKVLKAFDKAIASASK